MNPPFKLDLKRTPWNGQIVDSNDEGVAVARGLDANIENARRDRIILCVNAHADLVDRIDRLVTACELTKLMATARYGDSDTFMLIDAALADPAMDAVCDGLAKDAGLELTE